MLSLNSEWRKFLIKGNYWYMQLVDSRVKFTNEFFVKPNAIISIRKIISDWSVELIGRANLIGIVKNAEVSWRKIRRSKS